MNKTKKIIFSLLAVSAATTLFTTTALAASCGNTTKNEDKKQSSKANTVQTTSYADQMLKLATGDVNLAGAWGDARFYAKEEAKNIIAVGATEVVANDGIQVKPSMKQTDIDAIQSILIKAINTGIKDSDLTITLKGKQVSVFKVYDHNGYSKLNYGAEITLNAAGDKKPAYASKPAEGGDYFTKEADGSYKFIAGKTLHIQFIPSNDPTDVQKASKGLQKYLKKLGINVEITVSSDYNAAATALESGTQDVAFLPVNAWGTVAPNAMFILQAGRPVQIADPYKSITQTNSPAINDEKILIDAMNGYKEFNHVAGDNALFIQSDASKRVVASDAAEGYPEILKKAVDKITTEYDALTEADKKLPVVGYYRSYIFARKDSEIAKIILDALKSQGSNWKLNWSDVKDKIKYGYLSTTSSASYTFPEAWFKKHFTGFSTLS